MAKADTFENDLLKHIFQNATIPLIGDATGLPAAATVGSLFVALHTADPGEAGNQATSEVAYTGYARVAVARTIGGWTVTANSVVNAAAITFGARSDVGTSVATYFSVGTSTSGAGKILYSGALTSPASLSITQGIIPEFAAGALTVTED